MDNCPRCGFEVERGREADMKEGAEEHLKTCDDKKAIAAYKKKVAEEKEREKRKEKAEETQEDVMAFKTWEHNGRQVCVIKSILIPLVNNFKGWATVDAEREHNKKGM